VVAAAAVLSRTSKAAADQVLNSFSQGRSLLRFSTSKYLPENTSKLVPGSNVTKVNPPSCVGITTAQIMFSTAIFSRKRDH